jgi:hypothetical protein
MKNLVQHLNEMEELVRTVRLGRVQPQKYQQDPDLQGVSDIGNALVRYRTETTQSP